MNKINSLSIKKFRGLRSFELTDLKRVNLLVGDNNSGKTSVLEAIQLFASKNNIFPLFQILKRRGEIELDKNTPRLRSPQPKMDVRHLFYGHDIDLQSKIEITSSPLNSRKKPPKFCMYTAMSEGEQENFETMSLFEEETELDDMGSNIQLNLSWGNDKNKIAIPLDINGCIASSVNLKRYHIVKSETPSEVKSIFTGGVQVRDVVEMFEKVVLTKDEDLVLKALRTIDPGIERLATVANVNVSDYSPLQGVRRGGIAVKCKGIDRRIPIGSMGDGMWKMLALALALVSAKNGILLVDEIDTGLHYSVMKKMWTLVDRVSEKLKVQVFATTHSMDAWTSLGGVAEESGDVTIQRIEPEKEKSVSYTKDEIIAAAKYGAEVR